MQLMNKCLKFAVCRYSRFIVPWQPLSRYTNRNMATDGSDMFIWWGSGSCPCWRVLLTLQEKNLTKYGQKIIQFSKNEHKAPDVIAVNPRGQVPTFKHGNIAVNESLAVCIYLEETFKGQGVQLIPDNAVEKAMVLQRFHESAINFQSKMVENLLYPNDELNEEELKKRQKALADELKLWEGYLAEIGDGAYVAGKQFSLADTTFFSFLAFAVWFGLQLDATVPNLKAYYERVKQRPSVQTTWPPHWKESAGQDKLTNIFDL